jgi:hypothetical protein
VPHLGHVVSLAGFRIAGARVADIGDVPHPATGKRLSVAAPLGAFRLRSSIDLYDPRVWTPDCEESFTQIKEAVAAAPVLAGLASSPP